LIFNLQTTTFKTMASWSNVAFSGKEKKQTAHK